MVEGRDAVILMDRNYRYPPKNYLNLPKNYRNLPTAVSCHRGGPAPLSTHLCLSTGSCSTRTLGPQAEQKQPGSGS
ncbi:unnamed protein product [Gadus morhua 'NCC']